MILSMFGIDRTIIPIIVVPLVSLLMLNGTVTETCSNEVSAAFTEVILVVLALGSLAIGAFHHKEIKRIEASTPESEEVTRQTRFNALAAGVKGLLQKFIYKQPNRPTVTQLPPVDRPQQDPI